MVNVPRFRVFKTDRADEEGTLSRIRSIRAEISGTRTRSLVGASSEGGTPSDPVTTPAEPTAYLGATRLSGP